MVTCFVNTAFRGLVIENRCECLRSADDRVEPLEGSTAVAIEGLL